MKTLTWKEAYSNLILDDFVEDKIRDLENAKEYRKLNYIEGKNDPEENKKKPAGAGIRVIESEEYKKTNTELYVIFALALVCLLYTLTLPTKRIV